ncbi:hypothetical protein WJX82_004641 [Trebouxia sp. C0006]
MSLHNVTRRTAIEAPSRFKVIDVQKLYQQQPCTHSQFPHRLAGYTIQLLQLLLQLQGIPKAQHYTRWQGVQVCTRGPHETKRNFARNLSCSCDRTSRPVSVESPGRRPQVRRACTVNGGLASLQVLGRLLKALYSAAAHEIGHQPGPVQAALSKSFQVDFLRQQTATVSYPMSSAPALHPLTSPCRPAKQAAQPKNILA